MLSANETSSHTGATLWFNGVSGSNTTLLQMVAAELRSLGRVELLDGDVVRTNLCRDLGFSREDRRENVRGLGFVCRLLSRYGVIAIVAAISPYRADRDEVRRNDSNFIEIYMECPLDILKRIVPEGSGRRNQPLYGHIRPIGGHETP